MQVLFTPVFLQLIIFDHFVQPRFHELHHQIARFEDNAHFLAVGEEGIGNWSAPEVTQFVYKLFGKLMALK